MAKVMTPLVLDLSHHNEIEDWGKVYASGIRAVIHKATQGVSFVDPDYAPRKAAAKAAGLLWGAYHFADSSDVEDQVSNFLAHADVDDDTLLALDFEPNGKNTMSLAQAKRFLQLVFDKTEQRPILYSGNLLKELLGKKADPFFSAHRLWLAQYGPKAILPPGFDKYWLWQYSGDGVNGAGVIPGITSKGIDCNVFGGTDLSAEWGHWPDRPAPTPVPARADVTVAELQAISPLAKGLNFVKKAAAGTVIGSGAIGAAGEATAPSTPMVPAAAPDALLNQISVDNLDKINAGMSHTKAIVETSKGLFSEIIPLLKTLVMAIAMNEWIGGILIGALLFFIADKLLKLHLVDYVYGIWHPEEKA